MLFLYKDGKGSCTGRTINYKDGKIIWRLVLQSCQKNRKEKYEIKKYA